nr:hypothetical protein [Sinorhizobium americanum]
MSVLAFEIDPDKHQMIGSASARGEGWTGIHVLGCFDLYRPPVYCLAVNAGGPLSERSYSEVFSNESFTDVAEQFAIKSEGEPRMGKLPAHGTVRRMESHNALWQLNHAFPSLVAVTVRLIPDHGR